MKRGAFTIVTLLALASSAVANPVLYNPTQSTYEIELTLPNGEINKDTLRPGVSDLGYRGPSLNDNIKEAKLTLKDDLGNPVWSGNVKNGLSYLFVPQGEGKGRMVQSGYYGSNREPHAIYLMNISGVSFTVDLIGRQGIDAVRGIVPGDNFDPKKPIRFNPKESEYKATLKSPDGEIIQTESVLQPGRYYALFKNGQGKYELGMMGTIKP